MDYLLQKHARTVLCPLVLWPETGKQERCRKNTKKKPLDMLVLEENYTTYYIVYYSIYNIFYIVHYVIYILAGLHPIILLSQPFAWLKLDLMVCLQPAGC